MPTIFYDKDTGLEPIRDLTLGIIGYGNQGRAHALNLRDSGIKVIVGARKDGSAFTQATKDGFEALSIDAVAKRADLLGLLLPDEVVSSLYSEQIAPHLRTETGLLFAHGFVVHHKTIPLPEHGDILLVAPTGPGRQLRSLYESGSGLPALIAVERDHSQQAWARCLAYAKAIGCTRAGAIKTTIAEETVTDLFCEQAVLCGGLPELIKASFETLVSQGYQRELAYISCLKEVKLIADLLFNQGIDGMRAAISNTAKYGSAVAGPQIIDEQSKAHLQKILSNIEDGQFAQDFLRDTKNGSPTIKNLMQEEKSSLLADTGRELAEKISF
ncbi:MAG: ketol-acid reductoisomerase [Candidatus Obscuribacterales bacterium]|nr:ketol-acid reductoisomerase [Candidatus Obscuribacterales bacterium]